MSPLVAGLLGGVVAAGVLLVVLGVQGVPAGGGVAVCAGRRSAPASGWRSPSARPSSWSPRRMAGRCARRRAAFGWSAPSSGPRRRASVRSTASKAWRWAEQLRDP